MFNPREFSFRHSSPRSLSFPKHPPPAGILFATDMVNASKMNDSFVVETINTAIDCNNVGVVLLQAGHPAEALEAFRGSAKLMHPISKVFLVERGGSRINDSTSHLQAETFMLANKMKVRLNQLLQQLHIQDLRRDAKDDPFSEPEDSFDPATPVRISKLASMPESCNIASAALVYNMGLAFHSNGKEKALHKASCLYDMAYGLAASETNDARSVKICMASLHNAGKIHHGLCNYAVARQYLDALYAYIVSLPPSNEPDDLIQRQKYLLNAMLLKEPQIAGAA